MLARLAALVAAVAMVVGAVALRDRLDQRQQAQATTLRLVCATELARACQRLAGGSERRVELTVEAAGLTADRLSAPEGGGETVDGWLVGGPWPEMVRAARQARGLDPLLSTGPVLARSPVVLAAFPDRAGVLRQACGEIGWRCLGDVAAKGAWAASGGRPEWGAVKVALPDPSTQAAGLAGLGAATAAFFGRADVASNDLEEEGYQDWVNGLAGALPPQPVPLDVALSAGPSVVDVYVTVEAEAAPLVAASARPDRPELIYPAPVATADVALGTTSGSGGRQLAEVVQGDAGLAALAAEGWRVPGRPLARGVPATAPLAATSGLPSPGALDALRRVWREVAR